MFDLFDLIADSLNDTAKLRTTILYCIFVLLAAALYVLQGIALTYLCKASRAGYVWMAWVPFANQYLLGKQADVYTEDRVLRGEVSSEYAPSTLRRKMLGFSIVERVCGPVAVVAWCMVVLSAISGFFLALVGGFFGDPDSLEALDGLESILAVGILLLLVFGAVFLVFHLLYLVAACKAYYRLYHLLGSRVPALWPVFLIFVPLLTDIPLFILTVKHRRELTDRFFPPMEPMEPMEPAEEADEEAAPPTEPPTPELYRL